MGKRFGQTRSRRTRKLQSAGLAVGNVAARSTSNAAVALARWATTDHTGYTESLRKMPAMGFFAEMRYIFAGFMKSVLITVVTAVWVGLLFACAIPLLLLGGI